MKYEATSPDDYISQVPKERQEALKKLRNVIQKNIPDGFEEGILYNMIGYYVPLSSYPSGYHCTPNTPLPFLNIASQKNSINLYHNGIYAMPEIHQWFVNEYPKHSKRKLDMGKSCIRFKKTDEIPYDLIAQLVQKISVDQWISTYEKNIKNRKK